MTSDKNFENPFARSFRDLAVFQKAKAVSRELFIASSAFPREEMYSLTDQLRRAVRSMGAQIAEAWGKRRYERHFISKLTDADSEQLETQYWVEEARDCGYLDAKTAAQFVAQLEVIGRMLNGMILKSSSFCQIDDRFAREGSAVYSTSDDTFPDQVTG